MSSPGLQVETNATNSRAQRLPEYSPLDAILTALYREPSAARLFSHNMNPTFQLILLPGLGADHRLLEPQRAAFPQLIVPPWIPPRKHESLPQYAERMAETVTPPHDVPLVLGGVLFGGMLAYEMARC